MIKCAANAFLVTKISFINEIANSAYEATDGSDVLVVLAEWNEFRDLDFSEIKDRMRQALLVDAKNIYDPATIVGARFAYKGIGRSV